MSEIPHAKPELKDQLNDEAMAISGRIDAILEAEHGQVERTGHAGNFSYRFSKESIVGKDGAAIDANSFTHAYQGGPINNPNRHINTYTFLPDGSVKFKWYTEKGSGDIETGDIDLTDPKLKDRHLWGVDNTIGEYDNKAVRTGSYTPKDELKDPETSEEVTDTEPVASTRTRRKFGFGAWRAMLRTRQ